MDFSNLFGREMSGKASKMATDALWSQNNGTKAYNLAGKIFIGCGIVWILISIIPILCKEPISSCLWMWILAGIQIVSGIVLVILSTKSKRFQEWANKDFKKDKDKYQHLMKSEQQIKDGNVHDARQSLRSIREKHGL